MNTVAFALQKSLTHIFSTSRDTIKNIIPFIAKNIAYTKKTIAIQYSACYNYSIGYFAKSFFGKKGTVKYEI